MTSTFDESSFRQLWRNADEALQLQGRLAEVLEKRDVSTFDGLGHLLDALLPDDPAKVERIAGALHLPPHHLAKLRSSELDPLALPIEAMALLGRVIGLDPDRIASLMQRDHMRFATASRDVLARGESTSDPAATLDALQQAWERLAQDEATDL